MNIALKKFDATRIIGKARHIATITSATAKTVCKKVIDSNVAIGWYVNEDGEHVYFTKEEYDDLTKDMGEVVHLFKNR